MIREVKEETGLDIAITGLLGIYTDPQHVIAYADGEVRQEFDITYHGRVTGGNLAISDESTDVRFIDRAGFDRIPIHDTIRLRHHAEHRDTPYLGQPRPDRPTAVNVGGGLLTLPSTPPDDATQSRNHPGKIG